MTEIPLRWTRWSAAACGLLWYGADRRHRLVAKDNIRLALGSSRAEAAAMARENFSHLAQVFLETALTARISAANYLRYVEPVGVELLEQSLKEGKGVLLLTGHFGNWEWMAYSAAFFLPARLNVVVRPLNPPWLDKLVRTLREGSGNQVVAKKDATRPVLKALARNELVGFLLDHNASMKTAVYAPLFGVYVPTHRGMALIAAKSGAPVHPVFNWRMASGRYRIEVQPALRLPSNGSLQERVYEGTVLFNRCIEEQISRFPSQWYWVHRRFKHYSPTFLPNAHIRAVPTSLAGTALPEAGIASHGFYSS